ncbi:hypothetical protein M9H77_29449 [Catharanthus roseus]|uniref:Uncharacterized protein n=1 Tax=Catharanthus roseus TaxID=4058 RepID=A0ACB9ZX15_CATRO|nr:hypothetical protein M9H77_29449 [Catharanthus roseus]
MYGRKNCQREYEKYHKGYKHGAYTHEGYNLGAYNRNDYDGRCRKAMEMNPGLIEVLSKRENGRKQSENDKNEVSATKKLTYHAREKRDFPLKIIMYLSAHFVCIKFNITDSPQKARDYLNREFIISWYIIGNILLVIFQLPLSNFQKLGIFYSQGRRIENTSSGRFIHCTSFLILLREFRILSLYDWNLSK